MRQLRAWDDVANKMLYGTVEQFDDMLGFRLDSHIETQNPLYIWSSPFEYRDGSVAYPGDIVRTYHKRFVEDDRDPFCGGREEEYQKIGVFEYFKGYLVGYRLRWKIGHMMIDRSMTLWNVKAERIGTIYENPELLGG